MQVGLRYNLPIISPLDDAGVFTAEAGPFQGESVLGGANAAVEEALRKAGCLLKVGPSSGVGQQHGLGLNYGVRQQKQ